MFRFLYVTARYLEKSKLYVFRLLYVTDIERKVTVDPKYIEYTTVRV